MADPVRISVIAAVAAALLLLAVFTLVRSRRLQPRYALLWLLTAAVVLVLALSRNLLDLVAELMGIAYPPTALFVLGSVFVVLVLLHYSTVISALSEQNKLLAQRLALLEQKFDESVGAESGHARREEAA